MTRQTILNYGDLQINKINIAYEDTVQVTPGSVKRVPKPQHNGQLIFSTDISENFSKIEVTVRNTPGNNALFDGFYDNGSNNTILYRDKVFVNCAMEMKPNRKDQETTTYMFYGQPEV